MNIQSLIVYALVAMLAGYAATLWYVAVRRRRIRRAALRLALLRHNSDQAWTRLRGSAAGAP